MNGAAKASHVKDKLIEMTHLNETLYACGIACSAEGCKTASGNYQINMLLANVCKQNVTRFPYEIARLAEDIAGGLMVTMPSEQDLCNPETSDVIEEVLPGRGQRADRDAHAHSAPDREPHPGHGRRGLPHGIHARRRLPQAQRIMISRQSNLQQKKELAKNIAGITDKK
jgi:4-hydroxybutyryl-CoA dehydratase/vinylacetyl-CoA-Delta-isomerase